MKVVLRADVEGLGHRGDVVEVADGHGRNLLIPRGLALKATPGAERQAETMRRSRDLRDAADRSVAEEMATRLVNNPVTIAARAGEGGKLFGSVTGADIVRAIEEPRTLPNLNDSGAHQQLFAAAGEHVYLFSHYVRDAGLLSIEQAVHALTGRAAEFFGLTDRGVIAPGKAADLAVFALDEIELGVEERRWYVPHGTWRLVRGRDGFRATIAAGQPTWLDGAPTDARPGGVLRPVRS